LFIIRYQEYQNTNFNFGKSKTAQYGKCRIISLNTDIIKDFNVKKDELIYVSLDSRGIFQDKYGKPLPEALQTRFAEAAEDVITDGHADQ